MVNVKVILVIWLVIAALAVSGCSKSLPPLPESSAVRGTVLDASGKPIALGVIQFELESNPSLNISSPIKDGKFELKTAYGNSVLPGALPGTYRVTVVPAFDLVPVTLKVAKPVEVGKETLELRLQCEPLPKPTRTGM